MDRALTAVAGALLGAALLTSGPLSPISAAGAAPRQVFAPVLIYHHVKTLKPSDNAIERGLTVLPGAFAAQLRYLRASGYHSISAARLVSFLRTGAPIPPHPVVLTFDDGYRDVYAGAYLPLRRAHLTATFFIVPSFLGTPRYLTWRQVETMAENGMDIEAHTMTHPDLTSIGPRSVRWQLTESRRELESRLHRPVRLLAYPYGAYSPAVLAAAGRAGYQAAFTTMEGWTPSVDRLLNEPRVYVDVDDTPAIFAGRVRADPRILAEDPT